MKQKKIQNRLNLDVKDYKEYSEIEIEIIPTKDKYGKFINIDENDELYHHIYFNDNKEEIKNKYEIKEEDKNNEIENLEYELKLQKMAERGEGYLDYELNLWQNKINTLTTSFYQEFNNLKSEAYLDKNEFQNLIRNMKKICEKNQSYEKNNEPTEKEAYKNENIEIKKKEEDKIEEKINKNDDKKDNNINSINIEIKKDADKIGDENKNNDKN